MKHALSGYSNNVASSAVSTTNATLMAVATASPATSSSAAAKITSEATATATSSTATHVTSASIRAKALAKKHAPLIVGRLHANNAQRIYDAIEAAVLEALS